MAEQQYISLNPSTFVQGGLIGDIDIEVLESKWEEFDYGGKAANAVLALRWDMAILDSKGERGDEINQNWSAGQKSLSYFVPTEDGYRLVAAEGSTHQGGLIRGSNAVELINSLYSKGFPTALLDKCDASVFKGLICHVIRIDAPDRFGLEKTEEQKNKKFKDQILIVSQIHRLPGEKKSFKGAPAAKPAAAATKTAATPAAATATAAPATGAGTPAPAPASAAPAETGAANGDAAALALKTLKTVVTTLPFPEWGSKDVKQALFLKMAGTDTALRGQAIALLADIDWLASQGYMLDGTTLKEF